MTVNKIVKEIESRIEYLESKEDKYLYEIRVRGRRSKELLKRLSKIQNEKSKLKDMEWAYKQSSYR